MTHGGRLPAETTRFFGRAAEAAAIRGALGRSRLVTLTGPGGVGKTRIAIRVARELAAAFPDGVCMVQLSGLRDADLLPDTVAAALGLAGQPGEAPLAALVDYLRGKRTLIVLDTCEHLIDACAMFADVVLRAADGPRLLATSRQALDIPGEVVYPIPPLAVPDDDGDAVALFADRVAAAVPGFTITDDLLPRIVELCRGLDGIPLAIELAAVRLRAVGLDELLARLGDRLRLLAGGSRRVTRRHQTLRMTIGWSYELCSDAERLLWTRLSVFAGEFGLPAVETVCAGGPLERDDIIDALIGLVDKSIVLRADGASDFDGARYRMLDAVREYGAELLADADGYRSRHLAYHLALARAFEPAFFGPEQAASIERLAREHDNIRVALEYCVTGPTADLPAERVLAGLDLATSCWGFWMTTGRIREGSRWLQRLLDQAPEPTPQRVRGLWLASWFLSARGKNAASAELRSQARQIAARLGGRSALPRSMAPSAAVLRGLRALLRGAHKQAIGACDELLDGLPPGEEWVRGTALWVKSVALWFDRDLEGFASCQREGMRLKSEFGDLISMAHHLEGFAWLAASQAARAAGPAAADGAASDADANADAGPNADANAAVDGRPDDAGFIRAARLQGAADQMWRRSVDEPRYGLPALHAERERAESLAREALGAQRYAVEHAAGAAMSAEDAVRYALGDEEPPALDGAASGSFRRGRRGEPAPARQRPAPGSPSRPASPGPPARTDLPAGPGQPPGAAEGAGPLSWELLTAREREVATLVAEGLTNKDIAARLVVSKRTVDAHVEHILGKLGYSSRVQVAALASSRQPDAAPAARGSQAPEIPSPRAADDGLAASRTESE